MRAEQAVNLAQPITPRDMPLRVHVFEDFETEIEKRWWLVGTPETQNVPPSLSRSVPNTRCCRAGETKNYDREQEDQTKIWKAVIFNPVPGPPMGSRTRLHFRYWIKGTDRLRVQIYSLTNNYHRFLTLTGLPQEKWQAATVDMTLARRPDGSGGPLSTDERIDDIQFYIPREADLLIDDIVLYEEAAEKPEATKAERRVFPRRIIFTGWFDTGKQGAEWPGTFDIVPHEKPLTWKAAKSVSRPAAERPDGMPVLRQAWIRVGLRGLRPLSKNNAVRFRYRLAASERLDVVLLNSKTGWQHAASVREVKQNEWSEATIALPGTAEKPFADELLFLIDARGTLLVDDVLIYEPGE
jgi:hypothetical protein